jgi:hypothetical protein
MAMMANNPTMNSRVGRRKAREGGLQGGDARRDGDGHGQGVVHDQGGSGHEARVGAEVGPGDGVGPAPHRVGVDHLAVREHQNGQQADDGDRDGQDQMQRPCARHSQHQDDGFGAVGH